MGRDEEREDHPSYGMIGFYRTTGNPGRLFGSPLRTHEHYVTLRVSKGTRIHSLGTDRFHGGLRGEIIEVMMSAGQFSELLTTMNVGSGVPCTIQYLLGEKVPSPPDDAELEVEKVRKGFKKDMLGVVQQIKEDQKELATLLEKKTLTKADKERITWIVGRVAQHVESNAPFMVSQFEEAAEKVTKHAKAEIDAFITHNVVAEGLRAIQERAEKKALGEGPEAPKLAEGNNG